MSSQRTGKLVRMIEKEPELSPRESVGLLVDAPQPTPRLERQGSDATVRSGASDAAARVPGSAEGIIPDNNAWLCAWDIFIVVVLFVSAFYTPYAVALLDEDPGWAVVMNVLLDAIFSLDLALQFFVAYPVPVESAAARSLWVTDLRKIRARYTGLPLSERGQAGWFWIDALALLPALQPLLEIFADAERGGAKAARVFVLVRLLRLFRIAKLVRLAKYVERGHERYGFPYYAVEISKFALITFLSCHWLACLWVVVEGRVVKGKLSFSTEKESWLSVLIDAKGDPCFPNASEDPQCVYVIAYYWAMMTLTTVGYGDIIPQNTMEYAVCTVTMVVAAYEWAYIVGKIVTILEAMDPHGNQFRQRADDLQRMMSNRGLPRDLQVRLRTFLHKAENSRVQSVQNELVESSISEGLQREIAKCSGLFEDFHKGVYWAKDLQQDALLDLVRALYPASYAPSEVMRLYQILLIMRAGLAAFRGKILTRGDVWGQNDILLETPALIGKQFPRSISYVEVACLDRANLVQVCRSFPHVDRRLRHAQIRTAVFRGFIMASHSRSQEGDHVASRESTANFDVRGRSHSHCSPPGTPAQSAASVDESPSQRRVSSKRNSAVTSFISPGESRVEIPSAAASPRRPGTAQFEEAGPQGDVVLKLLRTLVERQGQLEAKVDSIHGVLQASLPRGRSPL